MARRLHVWCCLKLQKLASHKFGHLHGIFGLPGQRQPTATQGSGWRCTSRAGLGPQGPDQHTWNVRCIGATTLGRVTLILLSRNWPCTRSATCTVSLVLQGASAYCNATQRLALHVEGCLRLQGTRSAYLERALHQCHDACTCGAGLTLEKLALQKVGHLHGIFGLAERIRLLQRKAAAGAARRGLP